MRYVFLPAYSPDYNPIELAFSAIKAHTKREGEAIRDAMNAPTSAGVYEFLLDAVYSVTADDAAGWFGFCGYTW